MKQLSIIAVVLCILLGMSFTVMQSSSSANKKLPDCCQKNPAQTQDKKAAAPLPYFPVVNML